MDSIRCKCSIVFLFFVYCFVLGKAQEPNCVVVQNFAPNFNVCADGRVVRMQVHYMRIPNTHDNETGTISKDVIYSPQLNLSARIFLPFYITERPSQKRPVVVYFHGGLFSMFSYANPMFDSLGKALCRYSNAIVVSVDYRLAPEQHIPAAFEDSWTALQWIASHVGGHGPEEWLNRYADFDNLFLAGDSAGGTISVNLALRYGQGKLNGVNLRGMILQMPYFINLANITTDVDFNQHFYKLVYPEAYGTNNLLLNPGADPKLATLGTPNVFFLLGELDQFLESQTQFFDSLGQSGWEGKPVSTVIKGGTHMFYLGREFGADLQLWTKEMSRYISLWSAS